MGRDTLAGMVVLLQKVRALCPLPAGVQYALDTTGSPEVIQSMIEATGVRGKTVVVGATPFEQVCSDSAFEIPGNEQAFHWQCRRRVLFARGKQLFS